MDKYATIVDNILLPYVDSGKNIDDILNQLLDDSYMLFVYDELEKVGKDFPVDLDFSSSLINGLVRHKLISEKESLKTLVKFSRLANKYTQSKLSSDITVKKR